MSLSVGIRREDKSVWERRVPIIPDHVEEIRNQGVAVVVQPSEIRIYRENEYTAAGAIIDEDLSRCPLVMAVKEIPESFFRRGGAYMFFSHTIKGQPYNMGMLRRLMELECHLIDYERVVDDKNRRLIFFGWHAGVSGMIETLRAFGKRLEIEGIKSPFGAVKQPHEYESIREIKTALDVIGQWIKTEGVPENLRPLTVGFAGYGNVAQGAQEMLDVLPTIEVSPAELGSVTADTLGAENTIFKIVFKEEDMVVPRDKTQPFELQDYYDHPEKYEGIFERYLPNLSVLVNCIYWDEPYPRLVTKDYLKNRWAETPLKVIGDISCDIDGSIEATAKATDPGDPSFVWNPETDDITMGCAGNGPVIMAVDILPSEIPRDSSIHFSNILKEYVPAMAKADWDADFKDLILPDPIKRAVVVHQGRLTPDYEYMEKFLD
jgi:alpha-aminoadipic semialdehyde synthase